MDSTLGHLNATRLRELLRHHRETGRWYRRGAGEQAGWRARGYWRIRIEGKQYGAHRLAWLYIHGCWPACHIDHRDCNGLNNVFEKLRLATRQQNSANSRSKKPGLKGVSWHARGKKW